MLTNPDYLSYTLLLDDVGSDLSPEQKLFKKVILAADKDSLSPNEATRVDARVWIENDWQFTAYCKGYGANPETVRNAIRSKW